MSVFLSVSDGYYVLYICCFVWDIVGVLQINRYRRLESAWLGAVLMALCGLGSSSV